MNAAIATSCTWCGEDLDAPNNTLPPGSRRFCCSVHRTLFHTAARKFGEHLYATGACTLAQLRGEAPMVVNGPRDLPAIAAAFCRHFPGETADFTLRQLALLGYLRDVGPSETASVAAALGVKKPIVTRATDKLAHHGLVERQPVADDKRRCRLALTPLGREALHNWSFA
jgi:hypothetical protein